MWAIIDEKLEINPPKTILLLTQRIKEYWKKFITEELLQKTASGMKARLQKVIKQKGEHIGSH